MTTTVIAEKVWREWPYWLWWLIGCHVNDQCPWLVCLVCCGSMLITAYVTVILYCMSADIEDDAAKRLALSWLYGLWRLWQASRWKPSNSLWRMWHQLPHLLPWSTTGRGSAGRMEVQVVHCMRDLWCNVARHRRWLCVAEQLLAVCKVCQSWDVSSMFSQLHWQRAHTAVCSLWTVCSVTILCVWRTLLKFGKFSVLSYNFYRAAWNATRSYDEILSVRSSVCLSVKRVHCDKTEEKSVQIFIPCDR